MLENVRAHISIDGVSRSLHIAFPRKVIPVLIIFKRLLQCALLLLVIFVISHLAYKHYLDVAKEQRNVLYTKLNKLNTEIDSINNAFMRYYENEELLYSKFGLLPNAEPQLAGIGGQLTPDSLLTWIESPLKKLSSNVTDKSMRLEFKIDHSYSSYLNLQRYVDGLNSKLRYIPSIVPTKGYLSSPFGFRTHPVTGEKEKMHSGLDISAPRWTSIKAPADGVVETVTTSETLGRYVVINHGNGISTRYGHMEKQFAKEGQLVTRGTVIGYTGNTGRTTGAHLHYEVWVNGVPVNPIYYILSNLYSTD